MSQLLLPGISVHKRADISHLFGNPKDHVCSVTVLHQPASL
ncbi:hypothetical protein [Sphingomonas lacunae]|nr:hypothetical protein [Sphingomonas lacunae]